MSRWAEISNRVNKKSRWQEIGERINWAESTFEYDEKPKTTYGTSEETRQQIGKIQNKRNSLLLAQRENSVRNPRQVSIATEELKAFNKKSAAKELRAFNKESATKELRAFHKESAAKIETLAKEYNELKNYEDEQKIRNLSSALIKRLDEYNAGKDVSTSGFTKDEFKELAKARERTSNKLNTEKEIQEAMAYAKNNPAMASIKSVGDKLTSGVMSGFDRIGQAFVDPYRDVDTNTRSHAGSHRANASRQVVSEQIDNDALRFLYNTGMSGADSLGAMATRFIPYVGQALTLGTMGANAMADTAIDLNERGASAQQVQFGSLAAGVFEGLFARFSLGNLSSLATKNTASLKGMAKELVKSMGVNASEEMATEMANIVYDTLANNDISNVQLKYDELINSGVNPDEARKQIAKDLALQVAESGAAGALMGGVFSTGAMAIGNARYAQNAKRMTEEEKADVAKFAQSNSEAGRLYKESTEKGGFKNVGLGMAAEEIQSDIVQRILSAKDIPSLVAAYDSVVKDASSSEVRNLADKAYWHQIKKIEQGGGVAEIDLETAPETDEKTVPDQVVGAGERALKTENRASVSATTKEGNHVEITGVKDNKYVTKNGDALNYEDVTFDNQNNKALLESASKYDGEAQQDFISNYTGVPVSSYQASFNAFMQYGKLGKNITLNQALKDNKARIELGYITKEGATAAYKAGLSTVKEGGNAKSTTTQREKGYYIENNAKADEGFSELLNLLADKTGLAIEYTDSIKAKGLSANGQFMASLAKITISEEAQNKVETVFHESGHFTKAYAPAKYQAMEDAVVRYLAQNAGVNNTEDYITAEMKHRKMSREDLLEEMTGDFIAGIGGTEEGAREFIKHLKEDKTTTAEEKKTILQEIVDFLDRILEKLKSLLNSDEHLTSVAKFAAEQQYDDVKHIMNLFTEALDEASENLKQGTVEGELKNSVQGEKTKFAKTNATMKPTEATIAKLFESIRDVRNKTMRENGFTEAQIEQTNKLFDEVMDFMKKAELKYEAIGLKDVNNAEIKVRRDRKGNVKSVVMSAMVKNGEYPVNFDFSSICKKRQSLAMVIDELSKRKTKDGNRYIDEFKLTASNLMAINDALRQEGLETACLGCFVEAKRYNVQNFADRACEMWNRIVDEERTKQGKKGKPEKFNFAEGVDINKVDFDEVDEIFSKYEKEDERTSPEKRMRALIKNGGDTYQKYLSPSDLMTPQGIESIKTMSTKKKNFYGILKGVYGQAAPKEVMMFSPYNSEVALLPKTKSVKKKSMTMAKYLTKIGGIRVQSFSDFLIANIYDYMQLIADATARKFPMHFYTKEIACARLLGLTGAKINLSVMFDIDSNIPNEYAGLTFIADPNGDATYNGSVGRWEYIVGDKARAEAEYERTGVRPFVQSIGFAEAVELQNRPEYSNNVGIIGVGYSRNHILKMLGDNDIKYIIPYHSSSLPTVVAKLTRIDKATDYTPYQNTRRIGRLVDRNGNKVNIDVTNAGKSFADIYKKISSGEYTLEKGETLASLGAFDIYDDVAKTQDPRATANNYLEYCAKNNCLPVFEEFADHENYYKFLFDFSVYNSKGEYAPQVAVQNIYPGYNPAKGQTSTDTFISMINKEMKEQNAINEERNALMPKVVDNAIKVISEEDAKNSLLGEEENDFNSLTKDDSNKYKGKSEIKYSIIGEKANLSTKDSEGRELTKGQQEYFKDSKVRDENGNLLTVYHGTPEGNFTVFEKRRGTRSLGILTNYEVDTRGFFFSPDEEFSREYGHNVREFYLNVKKPLLMATDKINWDTLDNNGKEVFNDEERIDELYYILEPAIKDILDYQFESNYNIYEDTESNRKHKKRWALKDLWEEFDGNVYTNMSLPWEVIDSDNFDECISRMVELGYDGFMVSEGDENPNSWFVLNSNQIKSVANENPTDNPDIRYSTDNEVTQLIKQNEKLQEVNKNLKQQIALTKVEELPTETIEKISKRILKRHNSSYKQLEKELSNFYKTLADSNIDEATDLATSIASQIIAKSKPTEKSNKSKVILEEIRKTPIRLTNAQKVEVANYEGSYETYRRKLFGKANISSRGKLLSEQWEEWSRVYPAIFSPEINEIEQAMALQDIVNVLGEDYIDDTGFDSGETAKVLGYELIEEYLKIPSVRNSTEDKSKYDRYGIFVGQALNEYKQESQNAFNEKLREVKDEITRDKSSSREYLTEDVIRRIAKVRTYEREKFEIKEGKAKYRKRIEKTVKKINRLFMKNEDLKNVPDRMKVLVSQFMQEFTNDTSVFTGAKLGDLANFYKQIEKNEQYVNLAVAYDEDVAQMLDDLRETIDGKRLSKLTVDELSKVSDIMSNLYHMIRNENEIIIGGRRQTLRDIGEKACEENTRDNAQKRLSFTGSEWFKTCKRFFGDGNVSPQYFFGRMGGVMNELYEDFLTAQDTWATRMQSAQNRFSEIAEKYNYYDWSASKEKIKISAGGETIEVTPGQLMLIYATGKREQLSGQESMHIFEGGLTLRDYVTTEQRTVAGKNVNVKVVDPTKTFKFTVEEYVEACASLSEEQLAMADELVSFLSNDLATWGNEAALEMYGITKFNEAYYIPFNSDPNFIYSQQGGIVNQMNKFKSASFTKKTVKGANNPLILDDIVDVWSSHTGQMISYSTMVIPLDNMNKVFNYRRSDEEGKVSLKSVISNTYTQDATRYIDQFMVDVNGGVTTSPVDQFVKKYVSLFKKGATYASLSVVVQQPTSIARAMTYIDPKYFVGTDNLDFEELKRYAPIAIVKSMGRFDTMTGMSTKEWLTKRQYDNPLEAAKNVLKDKTVIEDAFGYGAIKADEIGWSILWNACKRETAAKTNLTGEDLYREAGKRFRYVTNMTQVYDSVLAKSQNMRSNTAVSSMVMSFMAEPTVSLNMMLDGIIKARKGNIKYLGRTSGAFVLSAVAAAFMKAFVAAARDEDEDKSYIEKWFGKFVGGSWDNINPVNMIPVARDIYSMLEGYSVERTDLAVVSDLITALRGLESTTKSPTDKIVDVAGAVGNMFGIPARNIYRDGTAIARLFGTTTNETSAYGIGKSIKEELGVDESKTDLAKDLAKVWDKDVKKQSKVIDKIVKEYNEIVKDGADDVQTRASFKRVITTQLKPIYQGLNTSDKIKFKQMLFRIRLGGVSLYDNEYLNRYW